MFSRKKVAVITDNDGDYDTKVKLKYQSYDQYNNIIISSDNNDDNNTFEICLYKINKMLIDSMRLVSSSDILRYMLREKAEFALRLLEKLEENNEADKFIIPPYIKEVIEWVIKD